MKNRLGGVWKKYLFAEFCPYSVFLIIYKQIDHTSMFFMAFGAGSQRSQNVYHCVRECGPERARCRRKQGKKYVVRLNTLLRRTASMSVRHSLQNSSAPSARCLKEECLPTFCVGVWFNGRIWINASFLGWLDNPKYITWSAKDSKWEMKARCKSFQHGGGGNCRPYAKALSSCHSILCTQSLNVFGTSQQETKD